MKSKPESNNKSKPIRPQELVSESQIVSSDSRNWCGVVVSRNIERPNELNTPPITHHFINLMTKRVNSGQPARQISRFAGLSFEGEYKPGDMFVIPAGVPGFFSWTTIDHTITLAIEPEHLRRVAEESFGMNAQKVELNGHINLRDRNIERLAYLFNDELERDAANGALYVDSLFTALTVHLLRTHCAFTPVVREYKGGLSKFNLRKVTDYINDNLSQELRLGDLSSLIGMSSFHFAKQFKQATGLAPHQYLLQQRVEQAKRLLRDTELVIVEVAYKTGFSSQAHLTNVFRRYAQVTPAAYRNTN